MNGSAALAQSSPASLPTSFPKWGPRIDFEAKPGTRRSIGEADLFAPLAQTDTTLLFADLRARFDDNDSREGNFGLGLRHMLASGWNLGVYGYYDRRRSEFDHYFNQATFGIEALGRDFDFRANAYLPFGERVQGLGSTGGGASTASMVGTTILVTSPGLLTREERALAGFDAEIGWRVPLFAEEADKALRLYAGVYHFDDSVVKAITGPRLRAEFTMYEVPGLWEGTRLTLGAEYQHDDVRGDQAFAMARLSIPLFPDRSAKKLTAQERRMTAYVVRDVDIVTETRSVQTPAMVETATATAGGSAITVLDSGSTSGAALPGAVAAAGANSTVVLSGTFNATATTTLQAGQTLMGAGTLTVATPSGRTATLTTPSATIAGTGLTPAIDMANNSTLSGMVVNLTLGFNAVLVDGVSGVTIANSTISHTGAPSTRAISISAGSDSITIQGNTLTATSSGLTPSHAILNFGTNVVVSGNTLSASGGTPSLSYGGDAGSSVVSASSTGNTSTSGSCSNSGTGTVTIDGIAC
jgi:hypothetical protein